MRSWQASTQPESLCGRSSASQEGDSESRAQPLRKETAKTGHRELLLTERLLEKGSVFSLPGGNVSLSKRQTGNSGTSFGSREENMTNNCTLLAYNYCKSMTPHLTALFSAQSSKGLRHKASPHHTDVHSPHPTAQAEGEELHA